MGTKLRIGGSDAATIMNASRFATPYELWQIKTGQRDRPDLSDNEAVQWGNRLERPVLMHALSMLGLKHSPAKEQKWITTMDGDKVGYLDYRIDDTAFIEVKTASQFTIKQWEAGVPEYYFWQIMHYFAIQPEADTAYVACLVGGQTFIMHEMKRDDEAIAALMKAEDRFLFYCREGIEPPMPVMEAEGETYNMQPDVADLCGQYLSLHGEAKKLQERMDVLKDAITAMVGNANKQIGQEYSAEVAYRTRKSFDLKMAKEAHPDLPWDSFYTTAEYYQTNIKGVKK